MESTSHKTCSVVACEKQIKARGWCCAHWARWRKYGSTDLPTKETLSCLVALCVRETVARGLCSMHYRRFKKTGETGSARTTRPRNTIVCSVTNCDRKPKCMNLCSMHMARWRRHGETGSAEKQYSPRGISCVISDCDKPVKARNLCATHHNAWRIKNGTVVTRVNDASSLAYIALHKRINRKYGSAKLYVCSCGVQARHWAYLHGCPDERSSSVGPYSLNTRKYAPLCVSCHRRLDVAKAKEQRT